MLRGQQEAQSWGHLAIGTVHSNRVNYQERVQTGSSQGAVPRAQGSLLEEVDLKKWVG